MEAPKKKSKLKFILIGIVGLLILCVILGMILDGLEKAGVLPTGTPTLPPTATATVTVTPLPTATPTPDLTATAQAVADAEINYRAEAYLLTISCSESITKLGNLFGLVGESIALFVDPNWRNQVDIALNEMDDSCVGMGLITQVPDSLKEVDIKMKAASVDMEEAINYFRQGVENSSIDTISLGNQSIDDAMKIFSEITEMMNAINTQ
jgi:hypothetical protein